MRSSGDRVQGHLLAENRCKDREYISKTCFFVGKVKINEFFCWSLGKKLYLCSGFHEK